MKFDGGQLPGTFHFGQCYFTKIPVLCEDEIELFQISQNQLIV